MWRKTEAYRKGLQKLLRVLRGETFKFVLIQYPHKEVIDDLLIHIERKFPKRSIHKLEAYKRSYQELMNSLAQHQTGLIYIPDFASLLDDPDLYIGFNQRRDKIAAKPIHLLAFIPTGTDIIRELQNKIPDFWAYRSLVLEFPVEFRADDEPTPTFTGPLTGFQRELKGIEERLLTNQKSEPEVIMKRLYYISKKL